MPLESLNYRKSPTKFREDLVVYLSDTDQLMSSKPRRSESKLVHSKVIGLDRRGDFLLIRNNYFKRSNLLRMEIYGFVAENYSKDGEEFSSKLRDLVKPPKQTVNNPFVLGLRFYRDLFEGEYSDSSLSRDARCMSLAYNNCVQPILLFGFIKVFGGPKMASRLFNEKPSLSLPGLKIRKQGRLNCVTKA